MPLSSARLHVGLTVGQSLPADLASLAGNHAIDKTITLLNGTAAGQADVVFSDTRTVAASSTDSLDLAGVLTMYGSTLTFVRIKMIVVSAADTNVNNVLVTRPATNGVPWLSAAGDQVILRPGGGTAWWCGAADASGIAVTAGTGDLLDLTNSGAGSTVTYEIMILGCSA